MNKKLKKILNISTNAVIQGKPEQIKKAMKGLEIKPHMIKSIRDNREDIRTELLRMQWENILDIPLKTLLLRLSEDMYNEDGPTAKLKILNHDANYFWFNDCHVIVLGELLYLSVDSDLGDLMPKGFTYWEGKMVEVEDVTPTWEGILPIYLNSIRHGENAHAAQVELTRMAQLADKYNALIKAGKI